MLEKHNYLIFKEVLFHYKREQIFIFAILFLFLFIYIAICKVHIAGTYRA